MEKIAKIVIKGGSGFCHISEAYEDKVTLTENSFSYEYKPKEESKINPSIKWSYKTSSPLFKLQFEKIAKLIPQALLIDPNEVLCLDIGPIEFVITYADKTKKEKRYFTDGSTFKELFNEILAICPSKEIPEVLK